MIKYVINRDFQGPGEQFGGGFLPGTIPVVGGLVDTFVNAQTAKRNTDKTIAAQKEEAEKAYQRSVAMWHMQNAYNSPEEQMKRFGAAGLSPHLIYGQGSAGNANSTPEYQAPNLQYRYEAPAYGGAVASILPTLMAVGTWMQNMRASEVDIQSKELGMSRQEQLIQYLMERNPRLIQELDNRLSLYPYSKNVAFHASSMAYLKHQELEKEIAYKFGGPPDDKDLPYGGVRAIEYYKQLAESRLKKNQADWSDWGISNPQGLMALVLSGVAKMAGMNLRPASMGKINSKAKRVKTFYQDGKRRSQVVDY